MKQRVQQWAMGLVDQVMAVIPRPVPGDTALRNCKIISHRGEHDNCSVMENTLLAFDIARAAGVWGIECDIRWTSDLVPVICHDPSTERVFGQAIDIEAVEFSTLRERLPAVPTLEEVLARYNGNTHLMLELKTYSPQQLVEQRQILARMLANVRPGEDFHVLALDPDLFTLVDFLAPEFLLPVSETNVRSLSRISLERGYCGLAGHFLLLGESLRRRHVEAGQTMGTGFPRSGNCLRREIGRGIPWIFSNDAVHLQKELNRMLADTRA